MSNYLTSAWLRMKFQSTKRYGELDLSIYFKSLANGYNNAHFFLAHLVFNS